MTALIDRLDAADGNVVWLDHTDYASALLAKGVVPWLDVAEFVSLQRRAQDLLGSDVVALALAPACAAWLHANPDLREAMGAKRRPLFPLKVLLADEALRVHLVELARGLHAGLAGPLLALSLPSPRAWVALAHAQTFAGAAIEVDGDDADSASVYIADFLRNFGSSGVEVLLVDEVRNFIPANAADMACYQALLNVAANYRWDSGLRIAGATNGAIIAAFDYVVAMQADISSRTGVELGEDFWNGSAAPLAEVRLRYSVVPVQMHPELVLERLASLRQPRERAA